MEIPNSIYEQYQINNEKKKLGYDISEIIIPFSKICRKTVKLDIYSGNEKIPFKERKHEFRMILKHEFSNLLKI